MRFDSQGLWWEDKAREKKGDVVKAPPNYTSLPVVTSLNLFSKPPSLPVLSYTPCAKPQALMDIECFPDYFLIKFKRFPDGETICFEHPINEAVLRQILKKYEIITFNGDYYDVPMLRLALTGASLIELKQASDAIIKERLTGYQFGKHYPQAALVLDHIDLKEVAPGEGSLKLYMGRLNARKLQDLPFDENTLDVDPVIVRDYCGNDLDGTELMFLNLQGQIALRRTMSAQYRQDLRSKSDAQIAETVLRAECGRRLGHRPVPPDIEPAAFRYQIPAFIEKNPGTEAVLNILESSLFSINFKGQVEMPKALLQPVTVAGKTYQVGIGGLHSQEECVHYVTDENNLVIDWDVASYYPSLILNCGLKPAALGDAFVEVYRTIYEERLAAKAAKDKVKAETLKITLNGSFGKLGSPYSVLYTPNLMIQVTVTGQLSLLMLIHELEAAGVPVVKANTDGIVVNCPRKLEQGMLNVICAWEQRTGLKMERNNYLGVYSRDVNNYFAVKADGSVKTKGCFSVTGWRPAFEDFKKNPQNEICSIALIELIRTGTPFLETLQKCQDAGRFITVRTVKGGAVKNGMDIGKVIRWYYAKGEKGTINYKTNNNQVPRTQGAKPLMELPYTLPEDIDYDWYLKECEDLLHQIGYRL